jgi:hypothetical protein
VAAHVLVSKCFRVRPIICGRREARPVAAEWLQFRKLAPGLVGPDLHPPETRQHLTRIKTINVGYRRICPIPKLMRPPRSPIPGSGLCRPICKPDAPGQAETGEIKKARDDFTPQVGRGQRSDERLPETVETHVGRLITQRSGFQIHPSLQGCSSEVFLEQREDFLHVVNQRIC